MEVKTVRTPEEAIQHTLGVFRRLTANEPKAHRKNELGAKPNRMYRWESEIAHLVHELQVGGPGMERSNTARINQFINTVILEMKADTKVA